MDDDDLDYALRALAHPRRREILERLLTDYKVEIENGGRSMTGLFHNHIPRLETLGFIQVIHFSGKIVIERGERWDEIEQLVRMVKIFQQTR